MDSELTASGRHRKSNGGKSGRAPVDATARWIGHVLGGLRPDARSPRSAGRHLGVAVLGAFAGAAVGGATSVNPAAAPADVAVLFRVCIIIALIGAGIYAQTSRIQRRMGTLLIGVGWFSCLWLLNGSSNRLLFSVGVVCSGAAPVLFAWLLLAHPTGHLRSRADRRFLILTGGTMALLWLLAVVMTEQPPVKTPLLQCTPHCPANVFSLGSTASLVGVVKGAVILAWLALTFGTPVLIARRGRSAAAPVRHSLPPITAVACAQPLLLVAYFVAHGAGLRGAPVLGAVYVGSAIAVPFGVLDGLRRERLFMGRVLADFVDELARFPQADPEALMGAALRDSSLRVAYRRPGRAAYVDASGEAVDELSGDQAVSWIERDRRPVAVVIYDPDLADYERFVHAAGAAALIRLEMMQLEADLKASAAEIAASRVRLMETAAAERRHFERDLHDGVQQHLVGLRLKLELATEAIREDPAQGERMLGLVGRQVDDLLSEVRALARGIYPVLLSQCGLREALRGAARSSPVPVEVHGQPVGRYPQDVEVAVYFCCLEALQNVAKHGGKDVDAILTLGQADGQLCFEVRDSGVGFDSNQPQDGTGLINMRDRIEAVGGTLTLTSRRGRGTSICGCVPVPQ